MKQLFLITAVALLTSVSSGCLTCCAPNYDMYPAYGGAWERSNRTGGRLGSVFDPAGSRVINDDSDAPSDAQTDAPTGTPTDAAPEHEPLEELPEAGPAMEPGDDDSALPPLPDDSPQSPPQPPESPSVSTAEPARSSKLPFVEGTVPTGPALAPADGPRLSGFYSPLR